MLTSRGYAALSAQSSLAPFSFERRAPGAHDITVDILYCGVCHTDLHQARNEWRGSRYPMVPGHEIVGRVTAVGSAVTKFKAGQIAAIGVIVDCCRKCGACVSGEECYCEEGPTDTYNATDRVDGTTTMGGYSSNYVVDERFAHTVPDNLPLAGVAPLLCAGITTYSPLRHWNVGPGMKVGIVGLGGLGHMALKFAHSFGAHVVQFTTSPGKRQDALRLGADEVVISTDSAAMKAHTRSFNNTVYYGAVNDTLKAFPITSAKLATAPSAQSTNSFVYPGTTPAVSADGTANGIVWAVENSSPAVLHAYDAVTLRELYNSNQAPNGRDHFGNGNKFITPLIANGKVFVGTPSGVAEFGLLP